MIPRMYFFSSFSVFDVRQNFQVHLHSWFFRWLTIMCGEMEVTNHSLSRFHSCLWGINIRATLPLKVCNILLPKQISPGLMSPLFNSQSHKLSLGLPEAPFCRLKVKVCPWSDHEPPGVQWILHILWSCPCHSCLP